MRAKRSEIRVKNALRATLAYLLVAAASAAGQSDGQTQGQTDSPTPATESARPSDSGVPIERLLAILAKKTGKKSVLDPRVHASVVLVGQDPSELSYPELLTVLDVYGYVAVEDGKLVRILPDGRVRAQALPTITSGDTRPGSEWVTEVIAVKNLPATQLVPLLRPMVPQAGHLVAVPDTNSLILTDRFANVRRLEGLIRTLDAAEPAKTLAPQK
ncbi:MAG TPA: secretin N-terminal domain-containing protein [Steroidobacteraceae bacterium]